MLDTGVPRDITVSRGRRDDRARRPGPSLGNGMRHKRSARCGLEPHHTPDVGFCIEQALERKSRRDRGSDRATEFFKG